MLSKGHRFFEQHLQDGVFVVLFCLKFSCCAFVLSPYHYSYNYKTVLQLFLFNVLLIISFCLQCLLVNKKCFADISFWDLAEGRIKLNGSPWSVCFLLNWMFLFSVYSSVCFKFALSKAFWYVTTDLLNICSFLVPAMIERRINIFFKMLFLIFFHVLPLFGRLLPSLLRIFKNVFRFEEK